MCNVFIRRKCVMLFHVYIIRCTQQIIKVQFFFFRFSTFLEVLPLLKWLWWITSRLLMWVPRLMMITITIAILISWVISNKLSHCNLNEAVILLFFDSLNKAWNQLILGLSLEPSPTSWVDYILFIQSKVIDTVFF